MQRKLILISLINILFTLLAYGQVKIRLFSTASPASAIFSVTVGSYELNTFSGAGIKVDKGNPVLITRYKGRLAVKPSEERGFVCDSIAFEGKTGSDFFSLRVTGSTFTRQFYSGDLECFADLGTIVMINSCNIESYVAGVVQAEGGSGKYMEYCKTQAILARTYMYRYFDKHLPDRYNVCDNTHCQAFNGLSQDSIIVRAALETKGLIILDRDSNLIISAFHSNCGGETSAPENVWLTSTPYLKSRVDPYCISSRNAFWEKQISLTDWTDFLKKQGYKGNTDDPSVFKFIQTTRQNYYKAGTFSIPLATIRSGLNLRSTFFSVLPVGDSVTLKGKGYGHGVGLCQEGAMEMARSGRSYRQIIDFYYSDVIITDIKNVITLDRGRTARVQ